MNAKLAGAVLVSTALLVGAPKENGGLAAVAALASGAASSAGAGLEKREGVG